MNTRSKRKEAIHTRFVQRCIDIANPRVLLLIGRFILRIFVERFSRQSRIIRMSTGLLRDVEVLVCVDIQLVTVNRVAVYCEHTEKILQMHQAGVGRHMDEPPSLRSCADSGMEVQDFGQRLGKLLGLLGRPTDHVPPTRNSCPRMQSPGPAVSAWIFDGLLRATPIAARRSFALERSNKLG